MKIVPETPGIYFNENKMRYEIWAISSVDGEFKCISWIDAELVDNNPRLKQMWEHYVWTK